MTASMLFLLPALSITAAFERPPVVECVQQWPETSDHRAGAEFRATISRYVEARRRLERSQPELVIGADAERIVLTRRVTAAALQKSRRAARRGDVFTPAVSVWLRHRIELVLRRQGEIGTLVASLSDPGSSPESAAVNAVLSPDVRAVRQPAFLRDLPELPRELEYRLLGTVLVLLDVDTRVVVDILAGALPSQTFDEGGGDESEMCAPEALPLLEHSPCDAHPELEMCWSFDDRVDVKLAHSPQRS